MSPLSESPAAMPQEPSTFDTQLSELTDDARRTAAASERLHQVDRGYAAALSGTFAGTLTEVAETRAPVTFMTRTGSSIRGTVVALGPDVVVVSHLEGQHRVLIRPGAIEAVVEQGRGHDRDVEQIDSGPELADLLDEHSEDNDRLALTLSTGNRMMGTVQRVGIDQVILRLDGDADTVTVPLHAIDQVATS